MGNVECVGKDVVACCGRDFPLFMPPNTNNLTYTFDFRDVNEISLCGETRAVSPLGFCIESQMNERVAPKWYSVKEYGHGPAQLRLCVSGRMFVQCLDTTMKDSTDHGVCAFKICTRGCAIYESVRTKTFTHTAQVINSGIFFALYFRITEGSLYLCPRITLVVSNGDEVTLIDDLLGPLRPPHSFYADFAVVDEAGRNIQLDLIFRGAPNGKAAEGKSTQTLRTCLQEYTAFNNQVQPAGVSFGYSTMASHMPTSLVHLQNLVVSEEVVDKDPQEPQPYDVWKEAALVPEKESSSKILFEGEDARIASMAIDVPEAPVVHPQLKLANKALRSGLSNPSAEDFWYHIRYSDDAGMDAMDHKMPEYLPRIKGEFWLSRSVVDKRHVYFHCSSTLAQALTMCIVFRFSCPMDYLALIESQAASVLRDMHIPTNGLVLGIEQDPRHSALLRMFLEHRNQILDDMVVCESRPEDLTQSIVHQEVYDGGTTIIYRLTILHRDGSRQSASLEINSDQFEYGDLDPSPDHYLQMQDVTADPSPRFPISPSLHRHKLSPTNRIFVYSTHAHEPPMHGDTDGGDSALSHDGMRSCLEGYPTSETTGDDWQSAGGTFSDGEGELGTGVGMEGRKIKVEWRRPLIESVVLLSRMEVPPFKTFPSPNS